MPQHRTPKQGRTWTPDDLRALDHGVSADDLGLRDTTPGFLQYRVRLQLLAHLTAGMSADYPPLRHAANLESVLTCEGATEMHTLVVGPALTGLAAFR